MPTHEEPLVPEYIMVYMYNHWYRSSSIMVRIRHLRKDNLTFHPSVDYLFSALWCANFHEKALDILLRSQNINPPILEGFQHHSSLIRIDFKGKDG